jgi:hypothetical protein
MPEAYRFRQTGKWSSAAHSPHYFSGGHGGESVGTFGQGQFLYEPSLCTHVTGGASAVCRASGTATFTGETASTYRSTNGIDNHAAPMIIAKTAKPFRSSGCVMPLRLLVEVSV